MSLDGRAYLSCRSRFLHGPISISLANQIVQCSISTAPLALTLRVRQLGRVPGLGELGAEAETEAESRLELYVQ